MREDAATLGIAGTAKNTGKTTTLNKVIDYLSCFSRDSSPGWDASFAVTSIGFDGEDFDTVTGLAKPRVFVPEGCVVATAQPLFSLATAEFSDLEDTGVRCALGRVLAGRAVKAGRIALAGPSTTRGLGALIGFLENTAGPRVVLVDGAFSRMAPMSLSSHLIVATGAARSGDTAALSAEINGIGAVMSLPVASRSESEGTIVDLGAMLVAKSAVPTGVSFVEKAARAAGNPVFPVFVSGPVDPRVLQQFIGEIGKEPSGLRLRFLFKHPINLLVSGDASSWPEVFEFLVGEGHQVAVMRSASLLGFTLNPWRPLFDESSRRYQGGKVDANWFLRQIRSRTGFPVTDLVLEGPSLLRSWMSSFLAAS